MRINKILPKLLNYIYLSLLMYTKQTFNLFPSKTHKFSHNCSPKKYNNHWSPKKYASIYTSVKSTSPSVEKYSNTPKLLTQRKRIDEKQQVYKPFSPLHSKNISNQFDVLKNRIKNVLRRMKYKDKLNHLQVLVKQAKTLSQKYGFFYITGVNFVYKPQNQIKLSLWIHPNLNLQKRMHPIRKLTSYEKQSQFYRCLKMALKQIFPTISLGQGTTYKSIKEHICELHQNLTKRLIKSVSTNIVSVLNSPRSSQCNQKINNNKILKVSRLIDFNQGISVIEEGDEEISVVETVKKKFWKNSTNKNSQDCFKRTQQTQKSSQLQVPSAFNTKKLKTLEQKRIPTSRSIIKTDQSMQMSLSNIMKEDEGQFTLEDSKVRPGTSEISSKLLNDLKQILNT